MTVGVLSHRRWALRKKRGDRGHGLTTTQPNTTTVQHQIYERSSLKKDLRFHVLSTEESSTRRLHSKTHRSHSPCNHTRPLYLLHLSSLLSRPLSHSPRPWRTAIKSRFHQIEKVHLGRINRQDANHETCGSNHGGCWRVRESERTFSA